LRPDRQVAIEMQSRTMKHWDTVAIVGVGLIGGSIGLALRRRGLVRRVVGIGRNETRLRKAAELGAITEATESIAAGVSGANLVVICTPVERIVGDALSAAEATRPDTLITDVGSTKLQIVTTLEDRMRASNERGVFFVGSHPMAGSERSGVEYSQADLFEDRVTIVTPTGTTLPEHGRAITDFWESLGSQVLVRSPEDHDRAVAEVSHLPHLVASALAAAIAPDDRMLAGGGWRDTTRVASGDVELWRQILSDNQRYVLKSLDNFEKVLATFRRALENADQNALVELLTTGKQNRDAVGS
jgi:prephenate dehydrogenase